MSKVERVCQLHAIYGCASGQSGQYIYIYIYIYMLRSGLTGDNKNIERDDGSPGSDFIGADIDLQI